ncbi:hypothetical protein ACQEVF_25355 [Nonomuraea polychroma]|uniref:hypothetical protein n=1 Tax=Nonomuraea polychroma TaxID=46176 RepID=UPI003D8DA127
MRPVTRVPPALQVGAYQTYAWAAPRDTRIKSVCEDVGCMAWLHGWTSTFDESTELGRNQADYVRRRSGRDFKESRTAEGLTVFRFAPYQRCFANHETRPAVWWVRGGDWRQDRGLIRRHTSGRDWVEDFAEHQDRLADRLRRG